MISRNITVSVPSPPPPTTVSCLSSSLWESQQAAVSGKLRLECMESIVWTPYTSYIKPRTRFKPCLCESIPGPSTRLKINRIVSRVPDTRQTLFSTRYIPHSTQFDRSKRGWRESEVWNAYVLEDSPLIRQIFCCTIYTDRYSLKMALLTQYNTTYL